MAEESLKDELRAALSLRGMRQPRNLLAGGAAREAEEQQKSFRERTSGMLIRLFRRR